MPQMEQVKTRPHPPLAPAPPANDDLAVLVVNEAGAMLGNVAALLRRRGVPVVVVPGAAEARDVLQAQPGIGVVVADVSLLQGDGLDLAALVLGGTRPATAVELLLLTGHEDAESGPLLDRLGVLREPLTLRNIEQAVHQALGRTVARRCQQPRLAW